MPFVTNDFDSKDFILNEKKVVISYGLSTNNKEEIVPSLEDYVKINRNINKGYSHSPLTGLVNDNTNIYKKDIFKLGNSSYNNVLKSQTILPHITNGLFMFVSERVNIPREMKGIKSLVSSIPTEEVKNDFLLGTVNEIQKREIPYPILEGFINTEYAAEFHIVKSPSYVAKNTFVYSEEFPNMDSIISMNVPQFITRRNSSYVVSLYKEKIDDVFSSLDGYITSSKPDENYFEKDMGLFGIVSETPNYGTLKKEFHPLTATVASEVSLSNTAEVSDTVSTIFLEFQKQTYNKVSINFNKSSIDIIEGLPQGLNNDAFSIFGSSSVSGLFPCVIHLTNGTSVDLIIKVANLMRIK